jgi:acetyl-CoA/propionyl-CoA carboxylase biotin carboxyl carrier protein
VGSGGAGAGGAVVSPMQGTVLSVAVAEGDEVELNAVICIVEAMKMENEVRAHVAGTVAQVAVAAGQAVSSGQVICLLG